MRKRILSILLSLVVTLSFLPISNLTTLAAETTKTVEQATAVQAGEEYLFVAQSTSGTYYAVENSNGSIGKQSFTFSGNDVTFVEDYEKCVWTAETSEGGTFKFSNDEKYIRRSHSDPYVKADTGDNSYDWSYNGAALTTKDSSGADHYLQYKSSKFVTADTTGNNVVLYRLTKGSESGTETEEEPEPYVPGNQTYVAFSSDVHTSTTSGTVSDLNTWINNVTSKIGKNFDNMGFSGDLGNAGSSEGNFWNNAKAVMDTVKNSSKVTGNGFYVCGNHEYNPGNYTNNKNDTTKKYSEPGTSFDGGKYFFYSMGARQWEEKYSDADINALKTFLEANASKGVPIFILGHYPLHCYNGQNGESTGIHDGKAAVGSSKIIELLNKYPNTFFIWGHNHSSVGWGGENHYDKIFTGNIDGTPINFTYASAGCMSGTSVNGKGLVAAIDEDKEHVTLTYYGTNANVVGTPTTINLKGGVEPTPTPVTEELNVTPPQGGETVNATIRVGGTLKVNVKNDSSRSAYDFTATSANTGVATVSPASQNIAAGATEDYTITGVAKGTTTVTISNNNDSYGEEYVRKTVINLTVIDEGDPTPTPVTKELNVTPPQGGNEVNATIRVGDKLTVHVTNGTEHDTAYDFTATSANTGIATVSPASQNIAAGATKDYTIEGVVKGTTTVTITNNSQYGATYERKTVINLTVIDEGDPTPTPVTEELNVTPPQGGETVNATIRVGGTLTVHVKNDSSRSAYDFTAISGDEEIATVSPASQNIAAGTTEDYTITGVAKGTTTVTISNNNDSYGEEYVRKTVINLTVIDEDDPTPTPVTEELNVTPPQGGNEVNATIRVGDTLPVHVTNGSEHENDYDFTAISANEGIATVSPDSQNIAAGATADYTITGVAKGTTTVTISNNNDSYGDEYLRKTVINLTVLPKEEPKPETYTVTFEVGDHGEEVAAQKVEKGKTATKPEDPSEEGWTFGGWYEDAGCTVSFNFETAITGDTTVYAKWTENVKPEPEEPEPTPKTGDNNRMFAWLALLFVSGGLFAGIIIYDKKSKKVE